MLTWLGPAAEALAAPKAERWSLPSPQGAPIPAEVRFPDEPRSTGTPNERLPALLVFGGFEHAAEVLDLVHPGVPLVLASFDYPFDGSREFRFPRTLTDAPALRRVSPATLSGIEALVDRLSRDPRVDPARIGIIGASFGSPFATAAAARDERIKALVLVHGFGDVRGVLRHRLAQVFSRRLGEEAGAALAGPAAWVIDSYLGVPRPEEEASRLRDSQLALMIEAAEDELIPVSSRESLWRGLSRSQARRERVRMPGGHLMPGSGAVIDRILAVATRWLERQRFVAPGSRP